MSILDTTIVAVALATLGRDFHVSVTTIQWVATGYLLALALVIPVTGWAVDRFGAKLIWMTSLSLFIIGSSLCGLAWSANSLIAFRVLQGIGGGMLLPVGQSILARAAGPQRMGRVMSIIGVPMVLGPIMGPVIGGLIVSNFSWRWIFYINVPIGIVTLILSSRWLPKFDTDERFPSSFDTLGFCLLSPGLAALVYCPGRGRHHRQLHQHVGRHQLRPRRRADGRLHPATRCTSRTRCSTCTRSRTATSPSPTSASS